jgi:hypothetical protein
MHIITNYYTVLIRAVKFVRFFNIAVELCLVKFCPVKLCPVKFCPVKLCPVKFFLDPVRFVGGLVVSLYLCMTWLVF